MEANSEKQQVLSDYAALLRSFLPQVYGCHCYGLDGTSIWSEGSSPPDRLTPKYDAALAAVLKGASRGAARVDLDDAVAYLVALHNEKGGTVGALAMLLPAAAVTLSAEACAELVLPARRTLERELSLRVRLVDSYRKLSVQAAEERLLHEVERAVQGPPDCQALFGRILGLCRHYLKIQTAAVLIPQKNIALVQGEEISRTELEMLLENYQEASDTQDQDPCLVRIKSANGAAVGILVLAGWKGSEFSVRRRSRVGCYVVTQIQAVIARAYDGLTGLPAWPAFEKLMVDNVAASAGQPPSLMYFDIDRLHVANDTLGRQVGDEVLASFAVILGEELAGHATTRIAADRFAALLMDTSLEEARQLGERIAGRFRDLRFGQAERSYRPSVSIGVAPVGEDSPTGLESDGLVDGGALATAQIACSAAKDRGRDRVEVYQSADLSIVQRFDDIQLVGYISRSIERGRLVLLGQPLVAVKPAGEANRHPYFEVLVRLLGDDDRHIVPADFLSSAERYQLMEDLDRWVVANTLELIGRNAAGLKASGARFAVNLSGQSLGSEPFLAFVQQQIERNRVPPETLCFEITETVAVANLQRAQTFMQTLRRTGCHFSLDDFGTGLSSFAYLKLFPVDTLKIDGSFIRDLSTNVVSQSVVAAIAEVARVMRLETVAEFVENQATLNLIGKLGITWAQGYFLGEPALLADRIGSLLASQSGAGQARSGETRQG